MKKIAVIGVGMIGLPASRLLASPVEEIRIVPEQIQAPFARHSNDIRDPRRNFYKTVNKPVQRVRRGRR